ncbi:MAG: hypothetical protein AMJ93_12050 [Anaerolineae bacterium SM23_84]|nr:MAG: hypothetical protein AMJ93_12050 [Anaerolineae bacterium SM23_84]
MTPTYKLVTGNGTVVTASDVVPADVAIRGERIVALGHDAPGQEHTDASDKYVLPGAIDAHTALHGPLGDGPVLKHGSWTGTFLQRSASDWPE